MKSSFISLIDGKLRINHDPVPLVELGPRIRHIMEYRAEHIVYVVADAGSSYAQFTEILDSVSGAVKNIHIGLISGANQRALDQHVAFFCSLRWPESEFTLSRTRK